MKGKDSGEGQLSLHFDASVSPGFANFECKASNVLSFPGGVKAGGRLPKKEAELESRIIEKALRRAEDLEW